MPSHRLLKMTGAMAGLENKEIRTPKTCPRFREEPDLTHVYVQRRGQLRSSVLTILHRRQPGQIVKHVVSTQSCMLAIMCQHVYLQVVGVRGVCARLLILFAFASLSVCASLAAVGSSTSALSVTAESPMAPFHGGTSLSCHRARANYNRQSGARASREAAAPAYRV